MTSYKGLYIDDNLGSQAKDRYKKRRETFAQAVGYPVFIPGLTEVPGEAEAWYVPAAPTTQTPEFLYLTGLNQTQAALLLIPTKNGVEEILFLPEKDPFYEFWEGFRFGSGDSKSIEEAQEIIGIETIENIDNWKTVLSEKTTTKLGLIWHESFKTKKIHKDNFHHWRAKIKRGFPKKKIENVSPILSQDRLRLDSHDIDNFRTAASMTAKAFIHTINYLEKCQSETQVAGILDGNIARQTSFRNSFSSIVACGDNAATLHYTRNNSPLESGRLLLLDFGARYQSVGADVSRTLPVNSTKNPLQELLYKIVLDVQESVEEMVKPGTTIARINDKCWARMETLLDRHILQKGGSINRSYDKVPHNVSHLIGHQVHDGDPFRDYRTQPLETGMIITNEPGFYGTVSLNIGSAAYTETLGIRIEDDLLITDNGNENLTKECPK